jgi:hypothetical protein
MMLPPMLAFAVAATATTPAEVAPRKHGVFVQVGPVGVAQPLFSNWLGFPGFTWGVGVGWRYREGRAASAPFENSADYAGGFSLRLGIVVSWGL